MQTATMVDQPTLLIASRNKHKLEEIQSILGPAAVCLGLTTFAGVPEVVEDASSFAGNATKKAVELARWLAMTSHGLSVSNQPSMNRKPNYVLADDSGLEVDALKGAPGVHSARFASLESGVAGNSPDQANNEKLLRLLRDLPPPLRTARFRCVLALTPILEPTAANASPVCFQNEFELQTELFEGACEGHIRDQPSGAGGFGYDPLFVPIGYAQSFAELGKEVKNRISHRANALSKLKHRLVELARTFR